MHNRIVEFKDKLTNNQKKLLKKILKISLSFLPINKDLKMLALKYGTDKFGHSYMDHYQKEFGLIRRLKLNILEIGIGGYKDPKGGGQSLRMWQEYFPNSIIYGIDIEDKSYHEDKRIKIFKGSQNDPEFLEEVAIKIGKINIVIDDGSHINEHVITSFRTLFPYLANGGIYVIEDLQTSYWLGYAGSWKNRNKPTTSMAMLKDYVDGLNYQYIPNRYSSYFDENIVSIHFYPKIVFIFKNVNKKALSRSLQQAVEKAKH